MAITAPAPRSITRPVPPPRRGRTIALVTVALGVVMDLLDTSIVNVALPTIQRDLHAGSLALEWFVAGYGLTFAAFLVLGGRMGDRIGYHRTFLLATGGFALASLAAGLAPSAGALIVARLAQGAMAALMVPQTTSLVQRLYSPAERSKVLGLLGSMAGIAAATGPLVGGLLLRVDLSGNEWRLVFLINLPLAVVAILAGRRTLPPDVRDLPGAPDGARTLDVVGAGLVAVALGGVVAGLTSAAADGWHAWTVAAVAGGAALLGLFAAREVRRNREHRPSMLVTALFRRRSFTGGLVVTVAVEAAFAGFMLTLTLALQEGLGLSAIVAGLTTLPMIVGMVAGVAVLGELLVPRIGRYVITLGATLLAAGMVVTALVLRDATPGHWTGWSVPALLVAGVGLGMLMGPLFAITLQDVEHESAGAASGTLKSTEQLGSVLGVTLLGSVYFGALGSGLDHAVAVAAAVGVGLMGVVALLSLGLPRRFRSEEELGLDELGG